MFVHTCSTIHSITQLGCDMPYEYGIRGIHGNKLSVKSHFPRNFCMFAKVIMTWYTIVNMVIGAQFSTGLLFPETIIQSGFNSYFAV